MTGQAYTSYTTNYGTNGAPTSATYSNGMTETWAYNADGTAEIDYSGVTGASFTSYSLQSGASGTPQTATYSNGEQAYWTYLSDGSHDVLYTKVTGQQYTAYEIHYGSNKSPTTAFYDNGMMATWAYNPDGSYSITSDGVTGASYTSDTINYGANGQAENAAYNNGMTSTWTYADDGARVVAYQGMSGSAGYTSHASVIDTTGQTVADAEDMNNGSGIMRIFGEQPHDLFVPKRSRPDDSRRRHFWRQRSRRRGVRRQSGEFGNFRFLARLRRRLDFRPPDRGRGKRRHPVRRLDVQRTELIQHVGAEFCQASGERRGRAVWTKRHLHR